jgi:hypothetical protein
VTSPPLEYLPAPSLPCRPPRLKGFPHVYFNLKPATNFGTSPVRFFEIPAEAVMAVEGES